MKKLIYCALALAAGLFATSCLQENLEPAQSNGIVTFSVEIPEIATKALGDDVTVINDLVYAVYRTEKDDLTETLKDWDNATYLVYSKNADAQVFNEGKTTVSLELINNQNYVILFWAQQSETWVKGDDFDLTKITYPAELKTNNNNADKYAAFSGVKFLGKGKFAGQKTAKLTRPFAQINIAAKDPQNYDVNVTGATVTVKGAGDMFNVASQTAAATKDQVVYTWTTKPETTSLTVNGVEYEHYAAMNYVFAYDNVKVAYDINTENHGTVSNEIINVPVAKNYRTNIVGNLLTSMVDYEVELDQNWGGEYYGPEFVMTPAYNEETKTWTITNAYELAWLAASVNGTLAPNTKAAANCKTFAGETVVLANDIDLENNPWTPIGFVPGASCYDYLFAGTFDGNGKTIRNLYVDNADCAGLFGNMCGATVKNLTIDGFTLKADHYAGAIVGWAEQGGSPIVVEECKVLNGNISVAAIEIANGKHDLGDKAGAIAGFAHCGKYIRNEATNVIINGYRDLGGIIGYGNKSVVTNNKIENITLVQNLEFDYKKDEEGKETPTTLANYIGREGETCTNENNIGEVNKYTGPADGVAIVAYTTDENGNKIPVTYAISNANGLEWISANVAEENGFEGKTVTLAADIDLFKGYMEDGDPVTTPPIGSTGEYDDRGRLVCNPFKGTFDGQDHTIKNLYQNGWAMGYEWGQYGSIGLFSELDGATVKNVTIEAMDALVEGGDISFIAGSATGTCVFEDITINSSSIGTYNNGCGGIIGWSGAGTYTFKNITIGEDVVLGGLWGSFDSSIGGVVGQAEPGATYNFENVTINCRIDAYNDCTASYDYYNYRMCGMIIGRCKETTTIDGTNYPDLSKYNMTFNNVVVNYGDWMNYHYCRKEGQRAVRVEPGYAYGGVAADRDHSTDNLQCMDCIPFDQLIGGDQYGVKGLRKVDGVTVNYATYEADDYSEIKNALAGGAENVKVTAGTYEAFPAELVQEGTTIVCEEGTVFEGKSSLNINGATVIGATFQPAEEGDGQAVSGTINGTFMNCTFKGTETLRWCYTSAGKSVVFENCVINTTLRGVHFDQMDGDILFKNCEINGFNAYSGAGTMTFDGCTFGNDNSNYNGLNIYSNTVIKDCEFNFSSGKTNFIDMEGVGKTLTIENCTATLDGSDADIRDFVGGSKLADNTVIYK